MAPSPKNRAKSARPKSTEPRDAPLPRGGTRTRPSRVRLSTDERRQQLLELGVRTFSERPYDEVSIDDVARAAGISKGLLYHYFPTKRHYYVETVRDVARRLVERTEQDPSRAPLEQLLHGLRAYLDFVEQHGQAYASLLRGGVGADPEVLRIVEATRKHVLDRMLEATGLPAPNPLTRTALRGWIGFVEATSLDWAETRDVAPETLIALWAGLLVDALPRVVGPEVLPPAPR